MIDPFYENEIDKLIPTADKEARQKVNELGIKSESRVGAFDKESGKCQFYNHCFRSEFFHRAMKRLAIEAGLRKF